MHKQGICRAVMRSLVVSSVLVPAAVSWAQTPPSLQGVRPPTGSGQLGGQAGDFAPDHFVVTFAPGVSEGVKSALAGQYGLTIDHKRRSRYFTVYTLSPSMLAAGMTPSKMVGIVSTYAGVAYAELDARVVPDFVPNDPQFGQQWHLNNTGQGGGTPDADVDAVEAWDVGVNPQVVVAVCDTGVEWHHPDLQASIWSNPGEIAGNGIDDDGNGFIDDTMGWDFADNDNDPDEGGDTHGTHVAGIVAATHNNGVGVSGVGQDIKIMALRHYDGQGTWMTDLANAIDYAWQNGADVITVSYNIDGFTQTLVDAIKRAGTADVVYCNSAGNNGQQNPPRQQIRNMSNNVIFVAATDRNDNKANFSNWGNLIEIGSPGVSILSTVAGGGYANFDGTSMATPLCAGIVAMVRAYDPGLSARDALDKVIDTADSVPQLNTFIAGGKRVNCNNAITGSGSTVGAVGVTVVMGTQSGGDLNSLGASDDNWMSVLSAYYPNRGNYAVMDLEFDSPVASGDVKGVSFVCESHTDGSNVTQFISFYNFRKNTWDRLGSGRLASGDLEFEAASPTQAVEDYVHPTTQKVLVRLQAFQAFRRNGAIPLPFTYSVDLAGLSIK